MKKLLMILGGIFIALIVIAIIGFLIFNYVGTKLGHESKVYVDKVVPDIIENWSPQNLIVKSSPELLEGASSYIPSLFNYFQKTLGPLKEYKGSEGQVNISVTPKGKIITATYLVKAVFKKSPADITG